ncbi:MAG: hypothetical protein HYV60_11135, partial [Planctomycetia bacterium]|nr:hypothetical protein [Planctomycetia bacterium]
MSRDLIHRAFWLVDLCLYTLQAWFFTRRWALVAQGMPAVILAGMVAFAVLSGRYGSAARVPDHYRATFSRALDAANDTTAEIGNRARAMEMMRELAPPTGAGHPRAHFWMAQTLLHDAIGDQVGKVPRSPADAQSPSTTDAKKNVRASAPSEADYATIIHHLNESLQIASQRQTAQEWLAKMY